MFALGLENQFNVYRFLYTIFLIAFILAQNTVCIVHETSILIKSKDGGNMQSINRILYQIMFS